MIVIDTNTLYLIGELDHNKEADLKSLYFFFKDKEICVTSFTLFELLNNKKTSFFLKEIVDKLSEKCKSLRFATTRGVDEYIGCNQLVGIENENMHAKEEARVKLGNYFVFYYSYFFSNLITACIICYFILYVNLDKNKSFDLTDDEYKRVIQLSYEIVCNKIKDYLMYQLRILNKNNSLTEKNIKHLLTPILKKSLVFYTSTINNINSSLEKNNFSLYKVSNKLLSRSRLYDVEKIINTVSDIDYKRIMLFEILSNSLEKNEKLSLKDYIQKMANSFIDNNPFFGDCSNISFKDNLIKILMTNEFLHSNDVADSLIVDCAIGLFSGRLNENNIFVTFDNKLIKKIESIKKMKVEIFSPRIGSR